MKNGQCWLDDQGHLIQAHGGMIARFGDMWYWYGENKDIDNRVQDGRVLSSVDAVGVSCYSSRDLHTWHYEGLALAADAAREMAHPLHPSRVMERPKVVYCEKTGKYVMWFHADSPDYTFAGAGCAVADRPEGPFTFLYAIQPNRRDCRDMTVYTDPMTGKTWLIHSGDWNHTLYFSELTDNMTGFTGVCHAQMADQLREAPAMYFRNGKYYCVSSGCTGWAANSALYALSEHLTVGMRLVGNPCEGENARKTFGGQSTYIFEADGQAYLMMDHWQSLDLRHSGYSILPIYFEGDDMIIPWREEF